MYTIQTRSYTLHTHTQYIGPRRNREDTHLTSDYREKQSDRERERGTGREEQGESEEKTEKIVRGC